MTYRFTSARVGRKPSVRHRGGPRREAGPTMDDEGDAGRGPTDWARVHQRLEHIETLVSGGVKHGVEAAVEATVAPAWRRLTVGEPRWSVSIAVVAALA